MALKCLPLSRLQLQHSLADRPTSVEEATSFSKFFLLFSKELFNYYKILFLGKQEDNLLPTLQGKEKQTQQCAAEEPGSQDSKHRGQCGLSWFSQHRGRSCSSLVWKKIDANLKSDGLQTALNCVGPTCDGKGQMVVSGVGDWIYYLSYSLCHHSQGKSINKSKVLIFKHRENNNQSLPSDTWGRENLSYISFPVYC